MAKGLGILLTFLLLAISSTSNPIDVCPAPEPPPHDTCGQNAVFTLHNIIVHGQYIYSTPSHLAVIEGYIDFDLTNSDVPYTTHCSGAGYRYTDFFYGEFVYQCDAPKGDGVGPGASASFTFSKPDGLLNVTQTWNCAAGK
jgi:hypothetical protein